MKVRLSFFMSRDQTQQKRKCYLSIDIVKSVYNCIRFFRSVPLVLPCATAIALAHAVRQDDKVVESRVFCSGGSGLKLHGSGKSVGRGDRIGLTFFILHSLPARRSFSEVWFLVHLFACSLFICFLVHLFSRMM